MPDLPTLRPALAGEPALDSTTIALQALPEGHLLQIMGATERAVVEAAIAAAGLEGSDVREAGYRQWYVVGDKQLSSKTLRELTSALPAGTFLSDQSHGRVRIRLSGPHATKLLSTGTAVDLHDAAFPEGRSAITLFGHLSVHLTRKSAAGFELIVLRSFAEALYEELHAHAA